MSIYFATLDLGRDLSFADLAVLPFTISSLLIPDPIKSEPTNTSSVSSDKALSNIP
jgi:hypothetical protein